MTRTVERWLAIDKWKENQIVDVNQKREGKHSLQSSAMRQSRQLICKLQQKPPGTRPTLASFWHIFNWKSTCYGCRQPLKPEETIPREPEDLGMVGGARREHWKHGIKVTLSEFHLI